MKIAIDVDDTVVDFVKPFLIYYNRGFNTNYSFEDINSSEIWKCLGLDKDSFRDLLVDFRKTSFFEDRVLYSDFKNVFEDLNKKHISCFVTSRSKEVSRETESFFKRNLNNFNTPIFYSGGIHPTENGSKAEICLEKKVDFLVDDNEIYGLDCAEKGIGVFLLDKPWNQGDGLPDNVERVEDWYEILEKLK
ncbi:MAG: hypothetical protein KKF48_03045 [Nanoarchaeota archaeon]|nr:hypothetical protein [Nanoarchaeota archaeon]MBU1028000.1 hypothetical protein [Nanoarchaeota archaeon]